MSSKMRKFDYFLRLYFVLSFVLISFLMTNLLYTSETKIDSIVLPQLLEYQRSKTSISKAKNNCKNLKVSIDAIAHLRRSYSASQEIFNYLSIVLNRSNEIGESLKQRILSEVSDRKNVVQIELQKAGQSLSADKLKNSRLRAISDAIANKIEKLQNPAQSICNLVPKLICKISVDAGFASGIHEILWCLISAFHSNRTVILEPEWTKYFGRHQDFWERTFSSHSSRENWNQIFKPLSSTCDIKKLPKSQRKVDEQPNTVTYRRLMNKLPKEFGSELISLVESPNSWFHSQFIGYILRPQPRLQRFINEFKARNDFKHPIVGIQVRRTDKITSGEALYYPISDYMIHVKDFFDKLSLTHNVIERFVYVASDDPSVADQLKKEFPKYKFISNTFNAEMASKQSTRYSNASLWGVLTDLFILSETDYIVCTFSSAVSSVLILAMTYITPTIHQICRLSYQLMRFGQLDASFMYHSLDVPFHYHHSLTPVRTALYNHNAISSDQWNLRIGDHLHERIRGRHTEWVDQSLIGRGWDSYFFASNSSSQRFYKLYPIYKVFDDIELV